MSAIDYEAMGAALSVRLREVEAQLSHERRLFMESLAATESQDETLLSASLREAMAGIVTLGRKLTERETASAHQDEQIRRLQLQIEALQRDIGVICGPGGP